MYRSQKKTAGQAQLHSSVVWGSPPPSPYPESFSEVEPNRRNENVPKQKTIPTLTITLFSSGGTPPNKNHICAFLFVCTFRTRPGTFETRQVVQSKKDLFKDRNKKNANPIKVSSSSVSPSNKKEANTTKTTHKQERRLTIKVPVSLLAIY